MASRLVRVNSVTVNDVLDGHVKLDVECLDRVYIHGYLGLLQVVGQVVQFLRHRRYPVPSPACLQQIGDAFRRSVTSFADANHITVVPLKAADRNIEVMRRYLDTAAGTGRSQVAAIGVAQEPLRVFIARQRHTDPANPPQFSFDKLERRVTVYYFYLWDAEFGPGFIKIATYCPWPIKVWVNGHEWAKRQAIHAGIGFAELSNGFASLAFYLIPVVAVAAGMLARGERRPECVRCCCRARGFVRRAACPVKRWSPTVRPSTDAAQGLCRGPGNPAPRRRNRLPHRR